MKTSMKSFIAMITLSFFTVQSQAQFLTAANFSEQEFVAAHQEDNLNALATTNGVTVVSEYQEGAAIIESEGKFGLINQQGYEICAPIYDAVRLFNHGYAGVQKNGKWTFVNKQGQKLTPLRYDWIGSFDKGLAAVMVDGKWGLLNEQGFEVVPTVYSAVKIDQDGKIWVEQKNTWKKLDAEKILDGSFAANL